MALNRTRAVFMRGGTSRALMFRRQDLPDDPAQWDAIFLAAMGSPDPNGRQLDGMGGGQSSLSKVCIVGPPTRADADLDYTVAQVVIRDARVDYSANCGNMSSAIAPFAIEESLIGRPPDGTAVVRMHNTSTGKIVVSRFPLVDGVLADDGDMTVDGVAGSAAPIRLEFLDPGGARTGRLLPTGNAVDSFEVDGELVQASLVDAATPCVFLTAESMAKAATEMPDELEADRAFMIRMDRIRATAAVLMGVATDFETGLGNIRLPKIGILASPQPARQLSGATLAATDMDILARVVSVGQLHRAVPLTGAICLAVAMRIPGSIPSQLAHIAGDRIRIAHPSGLITVDAAVEADGNGVVAKYGAVYRTARRLFEGQVLWRPQRRSN